jgi:hypothetical protein
MKQPFRTKLASCALPAVILAGLFMAGCGGGGGDPVVPPGLVASFQGQNATNGSLSMQPGNASGANFQVRIAATGIQDFFGARFHLTFDPASAGFVSADSSTSFLNGAGVVTDFDVTEVNSGILSVEATRVGSVDAIFTPDGAGSGSVSLQPGTANQDTFEIRVDVTDVNDFFGGAFHITFDSATAEYVTYDSMGSFLHAGGADTEFQVSTFGAGEIAVVATRKQDAQGSVPGVNVTGTQNLITLTFRATGFTNSNRFDFASPQEVVDSAQPVANEIPVSWSGGSMVYQDASGVDVGGTQDLIVLTFVATTETTGNDFDFADPREVCDSSAAPACNPINVTYLGGTLTAN